MKLAGPALFFSCRSRTDGQNIILIGTFIIALHPSRNQSTDCLSQSSKPQSNYRIENKSRLTEMKLKGLYYNQKVQEGCETRMYMEEKK